MFQESIIIIRENFLQFKGTGMYLALFFFCMIYIFLKEEDKKKKIFFVYYPLIIFFITLNPVFNKIVGKIFTINVYWRVFWMLPLGSTIAYGGVKFISEGKDKLEKAVVCIGIIVTIIISGKFVYNSENYVPIGNLYKVPDESVRVAQLIGADDLENKKAMLLPELTPYIRQIDANIGLAYKRDTKMDYSNNKYVQTMYSGNVEEITKLAKESDCNYIVMDKGTVLSLDFFYFNFNPMAETEHYVIYKLES